MNAPQVKPGVISGDDLQALFALGFRAVAAGPFVRSSYQAETLYREAK